MGAVPSNTFRNTKQRLSNLDGSSSNISAPTLTDTYLHQKVSRLEYQLEEDLNALKTYMISKEERVHDEFVGLFAPQPQLNDSKYEPTSPVDTRGLASDNNANHLQST
ncbi:hypothetical protein P3S68_028241 [Capsicum galapagoense]